MMDYMRSNGTYQLLSHSDDVELSSLTEDVAIADITKGSPDGFAKQITLIELSLFKAIRREEFASLKWNGKEKHIYAPNIVASTRWFNQINFWVQKEILKYSCVAKRTELLSFFIKIAKKLVDYNNLYSAMSIISALQVECIYRLRHTWAGLGNKDRGTYRRLEELFSQDDNCRRQREHMNAISLPGIPYLGLYLSDLTYTNVAFPRVDGKPSTTWINKMNDIIDVIAHFQQSEYNFPMDDTLNAYLCAQRYIEELQKFLEEDNYKTSLILEPPPPPAPPPSAAAESLPRCVSPSGKDDQPRKSSGFLSSLGVDNSLRGLPALAASFHGPTFRSSGAVTGPTNGTPTGAKSYLTVSSPITKAASVNSSFESDLTPPSKSRHKHHHRQQSSKMSPSSASTGTLTGKEFSAETVCKIPLDDAPDFLPSTPISRVRKRSERNGVGKESLPGFDTTGSIEGSNCSRDARDRNTEKAWKYQQQHNQSQHQQLMSTSAGTAVAAARSAHDCLPPVPPRPIPAEDSQTTASCCANTSDIANGGKDVELSQLADSCAQPRTQKPQPSRVLNANQTINYTADSSEPGQVTQTVAPSTVALIDSTAVAASAAIASNTLFIGLSPSTDHVQVADQSLARDDENSGVDPVALATSTPPHLSDSATEYHSSLTMSPGVQPSASSQFTVHIVYQGVIQRRSMTQLRSAHSGLAALLSPKIRKPSLANNTDIYGSASSLSTCSAIGGASGSLPVTRSPLIHTRPAGLSSWRRLWATLVLIGEGSAAFMIYFEPKCKRAMHRNQFHAHQCQVQSLIDLQALYHSDSTSDASLLTVDENPTSPQSSSNVAPRLNETTDLSTRTSSTSNRDKARDHFTRSYSAFGCTTAQLALGRHKDGSLDSLSFLLTDPSRNKVYRFRPLVSVPPSVQPLQPVSSLTRSSIGPLQWLRRSTTRMPGSASLRPAVEPTPAPNSFNFNTFGRPRGSSVPGMFSSPQFSPSTRRSATLKLNRTCNRVDENPDTCSHCEPIGPDLLVIEWMRAIQYALTRVEQFHRGKLTAHYTVNAARKNTV